MRKQRSNRIRHISKRQLVLFQAVGIFVSLALFLSPVLPVYADEVTYTDTDIDPDNPVLQQSVDIYTNDEESLESSIQQSQDTNPGDEEEPLTVEEEPDISSEEAINEELDSLQEEIFNPEEDIVESEESPQDEDTIDNSTPDPDPDDTGGFDDDLAIGTTSSTAEFIEEEGNNASSTQQDFASEQNPGDESNDEDTQYIQATEPSHNNPAQNFEQDQNNYENLAGSSCSQTSGTQGEVFDDENEPANATTSAESVNQESEDTSSDSNASQVGDSIYDGDQQSGSTDNCLSEFPANDEGNDSTASSTADNLFVGNDTGENTASTTEDAFCASEGIESDLCNENSSTSEESSDELDTDEVENQEGDIEYNSEVVSRDEIKKIVEIVNDNIVDLKNDVDAKSLTGKNLLAAGDEGENGLIDSGDINVFANVVNVLNVNMVNGQLTEIADNFENLTQDIVLNHPETTNREFTQNLAEGVCGALTCESLTSYALTNKNEATLENNITADGLSGENEIRNFSEAGIGSGDVNVVVNVMNIVNANIVNARWTIASINVFGDWEGDLRLPSELYFMDHMSVGVNSSDTLDVENVHSVLINVDNDNEIDIENNVDTLADSGKNEIESFGEKAEVKNADIGTGSSDAGSYVKNVLNTNVVNGKWFLALVNTVGDWSGGITSLPDEVTMGSSPAGLAFYSVDTQNESQDEISQSGFGNIFSRSTSTLDIINKNKATIKNNLDLSAISGINKITGEDDVENVGINSGNTSALATLLNFVNTNVVNGELFFGVVNVFGNWNGNISFGFPDLEISQKIKSHSDNIKPGDLVKLEVEYGNFGDGSAYATEIDWEYNSDLFELLSVTRPYSSFFSRPGNITFPLDRVYPYESGSMEMVLRATDVFDPEQFSASAVKISNIGPEDNKDNNLAVVSFDSPEVVDPEDDDFIIEDPAEPVNDDPEIPDNGQDPEDPTDPENPNTDPDEGNSDDPENPDDNNNPDPDENYTPPSNPTTPTGGNLTLLNVYTKNDSTGKKLVPGDVVTFTLTVDNDGVTTLENVIVYDELYAPDGTLLASQGWPIGTFSPRERVEIDYSIEIDSVAPTGTYHNISWAQGRTYRLSNIESSHVSSTFKVVNANPADSEINNPSDPDDPEVTEDDKIIDDEKKEEEGEEKIAEELEIIEEPETIEIKRTVREAPTKDTAIKPEIQHQVLGAVAVEPEISSIAFSDDLKIDPQTTAKARSNNWIIITFLIIISAVFSASSTYKKVKQTNMRAKNNIPKGPTLFILLALAVTQILPFAPAAQAVQALSCEEPIEISFPYAAQANSRGIEMWSFAEITGDAHSNEKINGKSFAKINGNASAVDEITGVAVSGTETAGAVPVAMPDFDLSAWRSSAFFGGTFSGDYIVPENTINSALGPLYIDGDLILEENTQTRLRGTIYVTGDIKINSNASLSLHSAYGTFGSVLLAEGKVKIDGNAIVHGGNGGGKLLIVAATNGDSNSIDVDSNFLTTSVVFYALRGGVSIDANSEILAAYGDKIKIGSSSKINYNRSIEHALFVCPRPEEPAPEIANIVLEKNVSVQEVTAGETVTFEITVSNTGATTSPEITVTDQLDSSLKVKPNGDYGELLEWDIGPLVVGATHTISFEVVLNPALSATSTIENIAQARAQGLEIDPSNPAIFTGYPAEQVPFYSNFDNTGTYKSSNPGTEASLGQTVEYTIYYHNSGESVAENLTIIDYLDDNLGEPLEISNDGTYSSSTRQIVWEITNINPQESGQVSFKIAISEDAEIGTEIQNNASLSDFELPTISLIVIDEPSEPTSPPATGGGGGSGGGGGGGSSVMRAKISVDSPTVKNLSNQFSETVTVTNTGSAILPTGKMTVIFPKEYTVIDPTVTTTSTNSVIVTVGELARNESQSFKFELLPIKLGTNLVTDAKYEVYERVLAHSTWLSDVIERVTEGSQTGETLFEPELPIISVPEAQYPAGEIAGEVTKPNIPQEQENDEEGQVSGVVTKEFCEKLPVLLWIFLLMILGLLIELFYFIEKEYFAPNRNKKILAIVLGAILTILLIIIWLIWVCPGEPMWIPLIAIVIFATLTNWYFRKSPPVQKELFR